jgi:hypothetical protein
LYTFHATAPPFGSAAPVLLAEFAVFGIRNFILMEFGIYFKLIFIIFPTLIQSFLIINSCPHLTMAPTMNPANRQSLFTSHIYTVLFPHHEDAVFFLFVLGPLFFFMAFHTTFLHHGEFSSACAGSACTFPITTNYVRTGFYFAPDPHFCCKNFLIPKTHHGVSR